MNYIFLTLFYIGTIEKENMYISVLFSLISSVLILIFFDVNTLFLATLLISIIAIKFINTSIENNNNLFDSKIVIQNLSGIWFALSIAPAISVSVNDILNLENGFLIQASVSSILFLFVQKMKPSIIARIYNNAKSGVGVVGSSMLSGAVAGIITASLWQLYIYIIDSLV